MNSTFCFDRPKVFRCHSNSTQGLRLARPIPSAALGFVRSEKKHSSPCPSELTHGLYLSAAGIPSKENSSGCAETSTTTPSDSTTLNSDKYARRLNKYKAGQSPTMLYPAPLSQPTSPPTLVSSLHNSLGRWARNASRSLWVSSTQHTGLEMGSRVLIMSLTFCVGARKWKAIS